MVGMATFVVMKVYPAKKAEQPKEKSVEPAGFEYGTVGELMGD